MKQCPIIGHRKTPAPRHKMSKCRRYICFIIIMDCQFMMLAVSTRIMVKAFFDRIPLRHGQSVCAGMSMDEHKNPPIQKLGLEDRV